MSDTGTLTKVERLIAPIVSDLHLDLYDLEFRGGTLRVTIDRPAGVDGGLDLDVIALASRLIGRELDHEDPMGGHYTLEITSPGLERTLRTPAHFQRSIGKTVALRLRDIVTADGERSERRLQGELIAADDLAATIRLDDAALTERTVSYDKIDRARTVFAWGPSPKPGKAKSGAATKEATATSRTEGAAEAKRRPVPTIRKAAPATSRERRAESRKAGKPAVGADTQGATEPAAKGSLS
jgi:ribosome maturation factor RimP